MPQANGKETPEEYLARKAREAAERAARAAERARKAEANRERHERRMAAAAKTAEIRERKKKTLEKYGSIETPEEYAARKAKLKEKFGNKETPEEYRARKARVLEKYGKTETPEEYKARKALAAEKMAKAVEHCEKHGEQWFRGVETPEQYAERHKRIEEKKKVIKEYSVERAKEICDILKNHGIEIDWTDKKETPEEYRARHEYIEKMVAEKHAEEKKVYDLFQQPKEYWIKYEKTMESMWQENRRNALIDLKYMIGANFNIMFEGKNYFANTLDTLELSSADFQTYKRIYSEYKNNNLLSDTIIDHVDKVIKLREDRPTKEDYDLICSGVDLNTLGEMCTLTPEQLKSKYYSEFVHGFNVYEGKIFRKSTGVDKLSYWKFNVLKDQLNVITQMNWLTEETIEMIKQDIASREEELRKIFESNPLEAEKYEHSKMNIYTSDPDKLQQTLQDIINESGWKKVVQLQVNGH